MEKKPFVQSVIPIPGVGFLAAGISLLANERRLWRYCFWPVLITVLLIVPVIYYWMDLFNLLENLVVPKDLLQLTSVPDPDSGAVAYFFLDIWNWIKGFFGGLVEIIIKGLIILALLMATTLLFVVVLKIISSPFNDKLAEKVEMICDGDDGEVAEGPGIVESIRLAAMTETQSLFIFLAVALPLNLFAPFLPGLGHVIAGLLLLVFAAFWFTYDALSYSMDRKLWPMKKRIRFLLKHPLHTLGFGLGAYALTIVPIVNFFMLPVFVSGGAIFFKRYDVD